MIRAAMDRVGLAFTSEEHAPPHVARVALVRVLEDSCPHFAASFLPESAAAAWRALALIGTLRL